MAKTRRLLALRHRDWLSHNERRLQMRKRWEAFFEQWDVMLLPVMPCAAIPHDHSEPQAARLAWVGGEQRPYWELVTWMAPAGEPVGAGDPLIRFDSSSAQQQLAQKEAALRQAQA